ncbi:MAG: sugar phosphate isomerase/epimerase, partial [Clostridia bacterium]|nr:sugar phosphate isomerase/epimerase [Clostridia bacterium]
PWMYPDTADSYLALIKAVDRPAFAAHVDIVNILSSPQLCYRSGEVIGEWFDKLGPMIRCCHAKDIRLGGKLTVHLDECRPGTGLVDYETYIRRVSALENKDICMMLEHMTEEEDYIEATRFIKGTAERIGIKL